jgi:hypothetical protein
VFNTICRTGAVIAGAGAASHYGSGSDQMMGLLAAPAPQHQVIESASTAATKVNGFSLPLKAMAIF